MKSCFVTSLSKLLFILRGMREKEDFFRIKLSPLRSGFLFDIYWRTRICRVRFLLSVTPVSHPGSRLAAERWHKGEF